MIAIPDVVPSRRKYGMPDTCDARLNAIDQFPIHGVVK
jgi:hypothetical protein